MQTDKLKYEFFNRNTVDVAVDLLGKKLVFNNIQGIITETEAYRGMDDPASHAYRGPTKRSRIIFDRVGYSYVYLIYGMYHCLNFITEKAGTAGAVLIRGVRLTTSPHIILDGPGKLCRHFGITREHNDIDITNNNNFYLLPGIKISSYKTTPRIGISAAKEKLWRFCI